MKTFLLKITVTCGLIFLFFTALTTSSCKKDETCHGKVLVVDTSGNPIDGANVLLDASSVDGTVEYSGVTDGSGSVKFDVKLPAIFDVTATKGAKTGPGILRLDEPGKDNEVTVTIK